MFTGIIQEIGTIAEAIPTGGGLRLGIRAPESSRGLRVGESVSVNGVCQTVVEKTWNSFTVTAVEETLSKTTLGSMMSGGRVNLELALQLGERLGGHIVLGHVDCVGTMGQIVQKDSSALYEILIPEGFERYVIPVGSIAVDGVSLTIASVAGKTITVSVIPHTAENTIFSEYVRGTRVNLEFDMIGKYVERLLTLKHEQEGPPSISVEQLKVWGYNL